MHDRQLMGWALTILMAGLTGCGPQRQTPLNPIERANGNLGKEGAHIVVTPGNNTTPDDTTKLVEIVEHLNRVEASSCFSDFMIKRGPQLIEKEINAVPRRPGTGTPRTTDQIVEDLTTKQVTSVLDIWHPSWWEYLRGAAKACAFENGDGHVHAKDSCYRPESDMAKGMTIAHELTHDLGYAHYTAENQESGNEFTVPYSVQYAIQACWNQESATH